LILKFEFKTSLLLLDEVLLGTFIAAVAVAVAVTIGIETGIVVAAVNSKGVLLIFDEMGIGGEIRALGSRSNGKFSLVSGDRRKQTLIVTGWRGGDMLGSNLAKYGVSAALSIVNGT